MLYPKYMLVNKSNEDIICEVQVIPARTNDYLMCNLTSSPRDAKGKRTQNIKLEVEDFKHTDDIDLTNFGTSGVISMNSK